MKHERLQILKMVQEGKVSPEEAAKLLEAVEQPAAQAAGAKATHIRIQVTEGGKTKSFSVGVGLARWVLSFVDQAVITGEHGERLDMGVLRDAVENGRTGKILEAQEGRQQIEVWLDA